MPKSKKGKETKQKFKKSKEIDAGFKSNVPMSEATCTLTWLLKLAKGIKTNGEERKRFSA